MPDGHVQRRAGVNGKIRYRARYRANGYERSRTFDRKTDADAWLREQLRNIERGSWVDPQRGKLTVGQFWTEQLLPDLRIEGRAIGTLEQYEWLWDRKLAATFSRRPLGGVTREEVDSWKRANADAGNLVGALKLLKRIFSAALDRDLIGRNPAARVRVERTPNGDDGDVQKFLSPAEMRQLIDTSKAKEPDWLPAVLLGLYGGLRWGEVMATRQDLIDRERCTVMVEAQVLETRNGTTMIGPPKGSTPQRVKRRRVSLPRSVVDALPETPGYLFEQKGGYGRPEGGLVRYSNWYQRVWMPLVAAAGLEGLRFHDLRHTSVALAIHAGGHPKQIQERLGHSSIRITLDIYGHLFEGMDAELAGRLDEGARETLRAERMGEMER